MEQNKFITAALAYAAQGLHVFPLKPRDKKPLTAHGFGDASKDPDQIRTWWTRWPDANIGLACGAVSGLFVVDIDRIKRPKKDGEPEEYEPFFIPQDLLSAGVQEGVRVITGKGEHYYFRYPDGGIPTMGQKQKEGWPVDVRSDGGYIVAPPSVHPSGTEYAWYEPKATFSLPPASLALLAGLTKKTGRGVRPERGADLSLLFAEARPHGQDTVSLEDVKGMLACLDPDMGYEEWLNVGMALQAGGLGVELWDSWSRRGTKYKSGECLAKWAGFNGTGGVTMGTLVYMANKAGWIRENNSGGILSPESFSPPTESPRGKYRAFSLGALLDDKNPMPEDLIEPRVLTPSGLLLIAGAPKVGKSDFVLSLLVHASAGLDFLDFRFPRPLRIFYFQAEIQYDYLRERLQAMGIPDDVAHRARDNLVITPHMRVILNEHGMDTIGSLCAAHFPHEKPDIIAVDPIRNVFDGGTADTGLGENDNQAMLYFLQNRVEALRDAINPSAGVLLVHHTKKLSKQGVKEDPFQAISGASSLRGYYTSGMVMFKPDESQSLRCIVTELRNGAPVPAMFLDKFQGRWMTVDTNHVRLVREEYGEKLDAERERRHDVILEILEQEAMKGRLYTANSFAEKFEGKDGLSGKSSIHDRISVLATKGYIKYSKDSNPKTGESAERSKQGFVCTENMRMPVEQVTEEGEIREELIPIRPTHYKTEDTGAILPVENPDVWVYPEV